MLPVVAIVGRPNVGKSTLFNRLVGFRKAAVHDRPGVTRDRMYEEAEGIARRFLAIDTGGLEPEPDTPLLEKMRLQTLVAVEEADVIVLMVDAQSGFTPADEEVASLLRRSDKPVVVAVNKVDGPRHDDLVHDFYAIGVEQMHAVSAEHGRGIYELLDAVEELLPPAVEPAIPEDDGFIDPDADEDDDAAPDAGPIRIAVIGRPNIGKSTLINRLLGEDRHLVHDMPGTTMDPIDSVLKHGDDEYVLVDTAGVRKRRRIADQLERFVSLRSIKAIERCHICLLMVDATEGITVQDAKLAKLVADRGRGLIILFNKWDLTKGNDDISARDMVDQRFMDLPHAEWAPHLFIAAKTGKGCKRILPMVQRIFVEFNRRISTSELNRWLETALHAHSPPQRHHRPVRIYYGSQIRVRPPTIAFFSNTPEGIAPPYKRYLQNSLRESYGFKGTPIRLQFRKRRKMGEDA